jgi:zinc protease
MMGHGVFAATKGWRNASNRVIDHARPGANFSGNADQEKFGMRRNFRKQLLRSVVAAAGLSLLFVWQSFAQTGATSSSAASASKSATPSTGASAATPTVDQILARYVKAIGGREAWEKLHSRTSLGTIEIPSMNMSGTVMIHEKAPNKVLLVVILAGQPFRQGYDGTVGWSDDPQDGLKEKSGAQLAETARDADFYRPLHMEKTYTKLSVVGKDTVGDREAWVVEAGLPEGGADKLYFDTQTGLIVRALSQQHTDQGVNAVAEDFKDYREVDGVRLPFEVLQVNGDSALTIKLGEVHHNLELDDSEFSKPAVQ